MQIIPSLVEKNANDLFATIQNLSPFFSHLQIDIQDGEFTPNKTLSVQEYITHIVQHPLDTTLIYDFHLQNISYEKDLALLAKASQTISINTVLVHAKLHPSLSHLQSLFPQGKIGIVINPDEDIKLINQEIDLQSTPIVQIMSVFPGAQGQTFIPNTLDKIEQLRAIGFKGSIYLDGGINEKTLSLILPKKPDVICPGSFLTKTNHLQENIRYLMEQIAQAGLGA